MNYETILAFWFTELSPEQWYKSDLVLDQLITERFSDYHRAATANELWQWRSSPRSALAEIIILDQFSRNIGRNTPRAFASDSQALALSQYAIENKFDIQLDDVERSFLYLPFMHSESAIIHKVALELYTNLGNPINLDFEEQHKRIIDRFGRYPHRNAILGRPSTAEEITFLQEPGSSF